MVSPDFIDMLISIIAAAAAAYAAYRSKAVHTEVLKTKEIIVNNGNSSTIKKNQKKISPRGI